MNRYKYCHYEYSWLCCGIDNKICDCDNCSYFKLDFDSLPDEIQEKIIKLLDEEYNETKRCDKSC